MMIRYIFALVDRQSVSEHLSLAQSHSTDAEEEVLMNRLEELRTK